MIIQGKNGSVVFWFRNKIVGSLPLGNHTMEDYYGHRDKLLREALEDVKLKYVKVLMWKGLHALMDGVKEDNNFICMTILCLIKLKQIDPDGVEEGILICPRKKPRRIASQ